MPIVFETSTVTTALTTAMGTVATDAQSAIAAVLPIALPILGALIVIGIGIKTFKKASSTRG